MSQRLNIFKSLCLMLIVVALSSCMTYNYADAKLAIEPKLSMEETPLIPTKLADIQKEPILETASTPLPEEMVLPPEKLPLSTFSSALIPLPTKAPVALLDHIAGEIEISDIAIIGITGEEGAVSYLETQLDWPTFRLDGRRLLVTKLETTPHTDQLFTVQIDPSRSIVVGILDFYPSNPFQNLLATTSTEDWNAIVYAHQQELDLPREKSPTLLLASLGQPSSEDWFETAVNHPYRIHLRWPYSDLLGEQGFLDSWRLTHYNAETDPGSTWEYTSGDTIKYAERIDYIYTQGLLPLTTETIPMGPWEAMDEQRSAIVGTFIVP